MSANKANIALSIRMESRGRGEWFYSVVFPAALAAFHRALAAAAISALDAALIWFRREKVNQSVRSRTVAPGRGAVRPTALTGQSGDQGKSRQQE